MPRRRPTPSLHHCNQSINYSFIHLPLLQGYKVVEAPQSYAPIRTPSRKLTATPTPMTTPGFTMGATPSIDSYGIPATPGERAALGQGALPYIKPEDQQVSYSDKLEDAGLHAYFVDVMPVVLWLCWLSF